MTTSHVDQNDVARVAADTFQDVVESGRQMYAAGQRIMHDLQDLRTHVRRRTEWRMGDHPWAMLGLCVASALLIAAIVPRRGY
jgi:hypothetical protein